MDIPTIWILIAFGIGAIVWLGFRILGKSFKKAMIHPCHKCGCEMTLSQIQCLWFCLSCGHAEAVKR